MRSTQRWPSRVCGWLLAGSALSGCGFSDGDPWGRVDAQLDAVFELPAARVDEGGRWKTSASFVIAVDRVAIRPGAIGVRMGESAASEAFDPANPPAGYSLCHNGHCHSDSGGLVDYEDIVAETGSGADDFRLTQSTANGDVELSSVPAMIPLEPCPFGCELPRGTIRRVQLALERLTFEGRVFDATAAGRVPPNGVLVTGDIELDLALDAPLDHAVDRGEPVDVPLALRFTLPPELFDGVDFSQTATATGADSVIDLSREPGLSQDILQNLQESDPLSAEVLGPRG